MGKSSVSIPYLVAWILGIICLAVALYLLYRYTTKSGLDCSQCSAEVTAWCGKCYKICGPAEKGWNNAPNSMDEKLKECISRCNLGPERTNCNVDAFKYCKAYIGI